MKKFLMLLMVMLCLTTVYSQNITTAEYFVDADPGIGNGTPIPIGLPGATVNFNASVPVNSLSPGFHSLSVRVRDEDGKWSFSDKKVFYISGAASNPGNITAAEYFLDTDPGPGNANPITVGATGGVVSFTAMIPASLSPGFHFLNIRVKDADGKWGMFEQRNFYISSATGDMTQITAAEYFFDNDPGAGNATPLTVTNPGSTVSQTFTVPVPSGLSGGTHLLAIRVRDASGKWGLFETDTLTIGFSALTCPADVVVNAPGGSCSAIVTGINPTVMPPNTPYDYSMSGATTGTGTGSASGKAFNAGVTTVTYITQGGATCSFTVTVNANAVPAVTISASSTNICPGTNVTFTATPLNGGAPSYQWKLNGVNVGTNSNTYQNASLAHGDVITVVMTSSLPCANPQTATSNAITMSVSGAVTPSVSIAASDTTICPGEQVTFTATPVNGGTSPSYQWKVNGVNVGANSPTYQSSSLAFGDVVTVTMTSSLACANPQTATSAPVTMTVLTPLTPGVNITHSQNNICAGDVVIFGAIPINGGASPSYQWQVNGVNVGTNAPSYQSTTFANGDVVKVIMTSNYRCLTAPTGTSAPVTITVSQPVPASVTISASATTVCAGTNVTFTATPFNPSAASYQWKVNGVNVGTDNNTYQSSTLSNGDVVTVVLRSFLHCVSPSTATSNPVTMTVQALATFYRDIDADGYGSAASGTVQACAAPAGYSAQSGDCNDNNNAVHPGATETCGNNVDDNCNGTVDENCAPTLPKVVYGVQAVQERHSGITYWEIEVALDKPAPATVWITYSTENDEAIAWQDYVPRTGTVMILAGRQKGWAHVGIIGDVNREQNEHFWLNFSNPVNVILDTPRRNRILIMDDDNALTKDPQFKIPSLVKRNQIWKIPNLDKYENEVVIMDAQGRVVAKFVNYRNNIPVGNLAAGIYFYKITVLVHGQYRDFSGRLLITE